MAEKRTSIFDTFIPTVTSAVGNDTNEPEPRQFAPASNSNGHTSIFDTFLPETTTSKPETSSAPAASTFTPDYAAAEAAAADDPKWWQFKKKDEEKLKQYKIDYVLDVPSDDSLVDLQLGKAPSTGHYTRSYIESELAQGTGKGGDLDYRRFAEMTPTEKAEFEYWYNKDGEEVALQYLDYIDDELKKRYANKLVEGTSYATDLLVGAGNRIIADQRAVGDFITGGYTAPSAGEYAMDLAYDKYAPKEGSNGFLGSGQSAAQIGLSTSQTIASQVPAIVANTLLPGSGVFVSGATAGANAYRGAVAEGKDKGRAWTYGAAIGLAEGITSGLLGGIGGAAGLSEAKLLPKIATWNNALARGLATVGINIASEEAEEFIQNVGLEPLLRSWILDEEYKLPGKEEMLQTAIVTALSSGLLSSGQTAGMVRDPQGTDARITGVSSTAQPQQTTAQLQSAADMVMEEAGYQTPSNPAAQQTQQETQPTTAQAGTESLTPQTSGTDESTAVNDNPAQHTPAEQALIEAYKESTDESLKEVIEEHLQNPGTKFTRHNISSVSPKQAAEISKLFGGDYSGFRNAINSNGIGHILSEHGPAGTTNHSMADINDIARMGWVLENYDTVSVATWPSGDQRFSTEFRDVNNNPAPMAVFSKKINGTYYVVEAVPDTKYKKFWVVSAYMDAKKESVTQASNAQSPGYTSNTSLASPLSANNIAQPDNTVNPLPEGTGAASAGFSSAFDQWQQQTPEGGFHPVNETAAQQMMAKNNRAVSEVPKVDLQGRSVGKTANTILNSPTTSNETAMFIEEQLAKGNASYLPYPNKEAAAKAYAKLEQSSFAAELSAWQAAVQSGVASADVTTMGAVLWNVANAQGNKEATAIMTPLLMQYGRNVGQAHQAMRMFNALTPEYQLQAILDTAQNLAGDGVQIDLSEDLREEFLSAKTKKEKEDSIKAIRKNLAAQVPRTFKQQFDVLRFTSMLLSPQSAFRNNVGNVVQAIAVTGKNAHAIGLEHALSSWVNKHGGKTKAMINPASAQDRALMKYAAQTYSDIETVIENGGRYGNSESTALLAERPAFGDIKLKNGRIIKMPGAVKKALNGLNKASSTLMSDKPFTISHYVAAYSSWLKANGITAEMIYSGAVDAAKLDAGQVYAVNEAQQATFKDDNLLSSRLNNAMKALAKVPGVGRVAEGAFPFVRTPANMFVRGVTEYSPIGLIRGVKQALWDVQRGTKDASEAINLISAGAVGTELAVLGAWMMATGMLTLGTDDDEKEDAFDKMRGGQNYALVIGDKSYSLSWLGPSALPLFFGAEFYLQQHESDGGITSTQEILDIAGRFIDPLMEMSLLSGVDSLASDLGSVQYYGWAATIAKLALNYYLQAFPTVLGKAENLFEDKRQQTFIDRDSDTVPRSLQYPVASFGEKVPFWDYNQIDYIDAWGRTESTGTVGERIFENFISPGYLNEDRSTPVDDELQRLYDAGYGDTYDILPSRPSTSTQISWEDEDGKKHSQYLTGEEYVLYATTRGQTSLELITEFMESDRYDDMTDAERAAYIDKVYEYSNEVAKDTVQPKYAEASWISAAESSGLSTVDYIYMITTYGTQPVMNYHERLEDAGISGPDTGYAIGAVLDVNAAASEQDRNATVIEKMQGISQIEEYSDEQKMSAASVYGSDKVYERYTAAATAGFTFDEWTGIITDISRLPQPTDKEPNALAGTSPRQDVLREYLEKKYPDDPETARRIWNIYKNSNGWKANY